MIQQIISEINGFLCVQLTWRKPFIIYKLMKDRGANDMINNVENLYHKIENVVRIGDNTTEGFITTRGVSQGSILSPLLPIMIMDISKNYSICQRDCM